MPLTELASGLPGHVFWCPRLARRPAPLAPPTWRAPPPGRARGRPAPPGTTPHRGARTGRVAGAAEEWPDGTFTASYEFRHALYQYVLYERRGETQRVRLHRLLGNASIPCAPAICVAAILPNGGGSLGDSELLVNGQQPQKVHVEALPEARVWFRPIHHLRLVLLRHPLDIPVPSSRNR